MGSAISVAQCNEGDILEEDVFNDKNVLLVSKGTEINKFIRSKLIDLEIGRVSIYAYSPEHDNFYTEFSRDYKENVVQVKTLLEELAAGKKLNYEKVSFLSSKIYEKAKENNHIVKCLNEIRNADEYTYTHCLNVAFYSMLIGKWLKLSDCEIKKAIQSGLLHDIGKSQIPTEILNKRGVLTKDEYEVIKKHTVLGYGMLDGLEVTDSEIRRAVLLHHERVDRSGYPLGASSDYINLYARIIAVADVFDAMTSERPYKRRATPFEAFEMFSTVGVGIFDTAVMNAFMKNIAPYYVGSNVALNNGLTGEIVYIPPQDITRPIIAVSSEYVDLSQNNDLKLVSMI